MRLVTWNCCGKFRQKARHIASLKPDILAVQEVEDLGNAPTFSGDIQPRFSHRVVLRPIPKSIGMFSYSDMILEPLCVMPGVRCYRAQQDQRQFQVMAVWTSVSTSGKEDYRQLHNALDHHDGWIRQRPTIVLGDFNQSARYKGDGWTTLQNLMDGLGLLSAYHLKAGGVKFCDLTFCCGGAGQISSSANGAPYNSPGQRPGNSVISETRAEGP